MWVVVVVSARPPLDTISRARRNIAVVLPPPPTSATTSPAPMPSASTRVKPDTPSETPASAARTRRRALDQLSGARLDPREEARHHDAHAEPRVALDVGDVDQRPGDPARLDDLLDRAVDGLLHLRMP